MQTYVFIFLEYILRSRISGSMDRIYLASPETVKLFPMASFFFKLIRNYESFSCSHTCQHSVAVSLFNFRQSSEYLLCVTLVLICITLLTSHIEHLFMELLFTCKYFLFEIGVQLFCSFFKKLDCFYYCITRVLHIFYIKILC